MKLPTASALIASLLLASWVATPALAHTAVTQTNIANEAHLTSPPETFDLTLQHEASLASIKLTDAAGISVKLDYRPTTDRRAEFKVPLPTLGNGSYKIEWKTIAADGHVMDGSVSFMVMQH